MDQKKMCHRCGQTKSFSEFYKNRSEPDGLQTQCKTCQAERYKKYYASHKAAYKKTHSFYYKKNKDKISERKREYYKTHKKRPTDADRAIARIRYANRTEEQIEKRRIKNREYQRKNKDKVQKWHKKYRETHKKFLAEYNKKYRADNKDKIAKKHLDRIHNDPVFKLKEQTRNMLRCSLRTHGHRKTSHTKDIIGCDLDYFIEYLKNTWRLRYHEEWTGQPCHIDHITPLALAETKEDVIKLCHYTNLQLLTPEDNMRKGATTQGKIRSSAVAQAGTGLSFQHR